ncbi:hypothetical protein SAICODRAFT_196952 [Saitoella complicata NRRL Y-17804]|uniref:uncharacterized protein n=1 Tax=Saitoella complicata (strain BCRC 22490 / CBS 7301 / JCM 7358 / NBRC 10748 / NRRL Y-17804) TaxID=698492 RepID=UPI000867814E|nr:uncharacterized protein SAICODRAFT_196952 [Saitoella complicata NRRL Y-17804]ODQ54947.1 hypothetical protein SAICODRAFT_196952 [Saitoella complicata NRRL Y-17804]
MRLQTVKVRLDDPLPLRTQRKRITTSQSLPSLNLDPSSLGLQFLHVGRRGTDIASIWTRSHGEGGLGRSRDFTEVNGLLLLVDVLLAALEGGIIGELGGSTSAEGRIGGGADLGGTRVEAESGGLDGTNCQEATSEVLAKHFVLSVCECSRTNSPADRRIYIGAWMSTRTSYIMYAPAPQVGRDVP